MYPNIHHKKTHKQWWVCCSPVEGRENPSGSHWLTGSHRLAVTEAEAPADRRTWSKPLTTAHLGFWPFFTQTSLRSSQTVWSPPPPPPPPPTPTPSSLPSLGLYLSTTPPTHPKKRHLGTRTKNNFGCGESATTSEAVSQKNTKSYLFAFYTLGKELGFPLV